MSLRVLMYHKVSEHCSDFLTVTQTQLKEQLQWLQSRYKFISLSDLSNHLLDNTKLPQNALLVTFDDGYKNNFTLAYPIFKALNIPFSIFLVSKFINKKLVFDNNEQEFLSINDIKEMHPLVEYGLHSTEHNSLANINHDEWKNEIANCILDFKVLEIPVLPIWAYTYGKFPRQHNQLENLIQIFNEQGVIAAMRIGNRINYLPCKNKFTINRIDIRGNESFTKFKWKVRLGKII